MDVSLPLSLVALLHFLFFCHLSLNLAPPPPIPPPPPTSSPLLTPSHPPLSLTQRTTDRFGYLLLLNSLEGEEVYRVTPFSFARDLFAASVILLPFVYGVLLLIDYKRQTILSLVRYCCCCCCCCVCICRKHVPGGDEDEHDDENIVLLETERNRVQQTHAKRERIKHSVRRMEREFSAIYNHHLRTRTCTQAKGQRGEETKETGTPHSSSPSSSTGTSTGSINHPTDPQQSETPTTAPTARRAPSAPVIKSLDHLILFNQATLDGELNLTWKQLSEIERNALQMGHPDVDPTLDSSIPFSERLSEALIAPRPTLAIIRTCVTHAQWMYYHGEGIGEINRDTYMTKYIKMEREDEDALAAWIDAEDAERKEPEGCEKDSNEGGRKTGVNRPVKEESTLVVAADSSNAVYSHANPMLARSSTSGGGGTYSMHMVY